MITTTIKIKDDKLFIDFKKKLLDDNGKISEKIEELIRAYVSTKNKDPDSVIDYE